MTCLQNERNIDSVLECCHYGDKSECIDWMNERKMGGHDANGNGHSFDDR